MPQSLTNILVHIIFSTKNRAPLIDTDIENELYRYLASVLRACNSPSQKICGTKDHVHILCTLAKTSSISTILEEIKKTSSKWIKSKGERYKDFYWQKGYGAFSIGKSGITKLISYIESQKEHHKKVSFKEEFKAFLEKYNMKFDERYLWD